MMYLLLIGAQVLLGIGATPVQPLGVSYIDDHVRRKDSSLYIGRRTTGISAFPLGWPWEAPSSIRVAREVRLLCMVL